MLKAALLASLVIFVPVPAAAGPATNMLVSCLADSTSGKERKQLARWIFSAMSTHPEMSDISGATAATREDASRATGVLLTRLLTDNCPKQLRAAMSEGSEALHNAFEALGKLAMQELLTNADVRTQLSAFEKYVDNQKLQAVMAGR